MEETVKKKKEREKGGNGEMEKWRFLVQSGTFYIQLYPRTPALFR